MKTYTSQDVCVWCGKFTWSSPQLGFCSIFKKSVHHFDKKCKFFKLHYCSPFITELSGQKLHDVLSILLDGNQFNIIFDE